MKIDPLVAWLLTFALHAGVMLSIAWLLDRTVLRRLPAWRELLWRVALFGGALSASAQLALSSPFAARFAFEHGDAAAAVQVAATRIDDTDQARSTIEFANRNTRMFCTVSFPR